MRTCGELTTSAGIPVTGTMGFLNALFAVMTQHNYDCVVPCAEGGNNWRKKETGEYKGTRQSQDVAFYADQSLLLEEVLPTLGMTVCKQPGFEADDVIAMVLHTFGQQKVGGTKSRLFAQEHHGVVSNGLVKRCAHGFPVRKQLG